MQRLYFIITLCFISVVLSGQHKVQFILEEKTEIKHDSIYIVGTFNNWDSLSNNNYLMQSLEDNKKSIILSLNLGEIEYKFHRGSWQSVEKEYFGDEVDNRKILIYKDTIVVDSVVAWRDEIIIDKKLTLKNTPDLSDQVPIMASIAQNYAFQAEYYNVDSAFHYVQKAIDLQKQIISASNYEVNEEQVGRMFWLKELVASLLHSLGNYPKSLELRLENLALTEDHGSNIEMVRAINNLIEDFMSMKDYQSTLKYAKQAEELLSGFPEDDQNLIGLVANTWDNISRAYFNNGNLDLALKYAMKCDEELRGTGYIYFIAHVNVLLANIYADMGDNATALSYYQKALREAPTYGYQTIAETKIGMAKVYSKEGKINLALINAQQAMNFFQSNRITIQSWGQNSDTYIAELSPLISDLYRRAGKPDSAYYYLQLSVALKDSLYNTDKVRQFQTLTFNDASRRQQMEQEKLEAKQQFETKIKLYGLITGLVGVLLLAFILYRNNKQKQKANALLTSQKSEIETTLNELKNTQAQLIQSEKMASLGELTAGIAHEIQNPLNFVNNFSEVSGEMIEEANEEIESGDINEAKEILKDLKVNLDKINHHGQRASGIVKSMLDHSRTSSGEKVKTDINALCDEYLRLAYHGMRAKGRSFNADFTTDFDESLPIIKVIPQDIGRVLLNLINNAFQACNEVSEMPSLEAMSSLRPKVKVTTKKLGDKIEITVSDNGPGIPDEIKDKIFQPFFTTKPTGEGTGLGLSLSYDIVKVHGGELDVESKEGEGTVFIVSLPV